MVLHVERCLEAHHETTLVFHFIGAFYGQNFACVR
ncbi:hypothetical protein NITHO_1510003 [Nitrolancea hollandica Lb]|uniref:Uncharacterized protein n=1 Tax=Nitrolancea hollandica Lb TaxID=1129897 RepID=I4EDI5_9BACT|nr:hypothetical protein NITHO_1510003 [Nitrolancea hollandica Lb]